MMIWIRRIGFVLLACAFLAPAGAYLLDAALGREVLIITPKSRESIEMDREMWEKGDPVAEIYGIPSDRTVHVLFIDPAKLITPKEDPSLVLLPVDKQAGENPLQVKTVFFMAWRAAAGFLAGGLFFLGLAWFMSRRKSASTT
ncbi:MAG: hypothetical protein GXP54_08830 [Deltaproteobacteria bacterium]|nr:hypothetical protein [Deltaproteobacteria bacterium]